MSGRAAVVSIGTNSTRVLLADMSPGLPRQVLARTIGTRIGEGLGERGRLGDEPMRRTLDAVAQLHRAIRGRYVSLDAVTTSALRRADNADEFLEKIRDIIGTTMRVLTGEEEARASYRGATAALGRLDGDRVGVIDTGGGSTEFASGTEVVPDAAVSCEIGAVRLTELVPALNGRSGPVADAEIERARVVAREALEPLRGSEPVDRLVFVGGTATTSAAIARGKPGRIESAPLSRADLANVLARVVALGLDERKTLPGMRPQRADILPAGIVILQTVMDVLDREAVAATGNDLLLGVLLERRAARPAAGLPYSPRAGTQTPKGHR